MNRSKNPFALNGIKNRALRWLIRRISGIDHLDKTYQQWLDQKTDRQTGANTSSFLKFSLKSLDVRWHVENAEKLRDIPQQGPVVFVANHPLGGLEGLILTLVLSQARPDLKVLTNELLSLIPEFKNTFIGVDVLNANRAQKNAKGIRQVTRHLSAGGALLVFPAGTVSGISLPKLDISDADWNPMIMRLASKFDAPVTPIFVKGRNSLGFYLSAYIHKRLRTLLLPRAMLEKSGSTIRFSVGDRIDAKELKRLKNDQVATHFVRLCCELLGKDTRPIESNSSKQEEIRKSSCDQQIATEIEKLEPYSLYDQDKYQVFCAPYSAMGLLMEPLCIVRESTFRAVSEGTGKELDTDDFDKNYQHLFLWDKEKQKIAGGYRLGKADKISEEFGLKGLYSHSLFDYNQEFLDGLGKTIEVGRSFVANEYQRDPVALDLLWKGIGRFVAKNPEYHTLFGCVSISRDYSMLARSMLIQTFLSHYGAEVSITNQVKARDPLKFDQTPWSDEQLSQLSDIPIINKLVGRIDSGKSIPTLIRHYLSLNGRFVSFTNNQGFNGALDGFILVDLRNTPQRYLKRYLGEQGVQTFEKTHSQDDLETSISATA